MRILFLSHFIPHPPTDGASLRNYNIVRELARTHNVHLLTFTQRNRHPDRRRIEQSREILQEYCRDVSIVNVPTDMSRLGWYALLGLNLASAAPYSVWRFGSRAMATALNRQLDSHTFDVVHVDTIGLWRYAEMLRGLPVVLNHHNVESSLFLRRAATERNPLTRAYVGLQGRKLRNAERSALRRSPAAWRQPQPSRPRALTEGRPLRPSGGAFRRASSEFDP